MNDHLRRAVAGGARPAAGADPRSAAAPYRMRHRLASAATYALGCAAPLVHPDSRFIIVTSGRTGSELLVTLLDSHPRIVCDGEILARRVDAPSRLVAGRQTRAALLGASAYGFKLLGQHIRYIQPVRDPATFLSGAHHDGVKLIRLRRRSLLDQAISSVRAARSAWHYTRADRATFVAPTLDAVEVLATMVIIEDAERYLDDRLEGLAVRELTYEGDLLRPEDRRRSADDICRDLALAPVPLASDLVRITPERSSLAVANYDEIRRVVAATRFAAQLEPDGEPDGDVTG